jgi:co-chaperonin GroES (HSP10)
MTVYPTSDKIMVKLRNASSALSSQVRTEVADVVAVHPDEKMWKVGDVLLLKAWAVDVFNVGGEEFAFIDRAHNAICGTVTE